VTSTFVTSQVFVILRANHEGFTGPPADDQAGNRAVNVAGLVADPDGTGRPAGPLISPPTRAGRELTITDKVKWEACIGVVMH